MKKRRGQTGVELMVVLGIIMVLFIIIGFLVYRAYVRSNDLKIYIAGERLVNRIADKINTLNAVSDGHSTTLSIPAELFGARNYTVKFYENESAAFIEGSAFSTGSDLRFSSPLSTSNVNCLLPECTRGCNATSSEQCLKVDEAMEITLKKHAGGVYLTQKHNLAQEGLNADVAAYDLAGKPDPANPPAFVTEAGASRNVVYVHHNTADRTYALVFSMARQGGVTSLSFVNMTGRLLELRSDDAGEFAIDPATGLPDAAWDTPLAEPVDGGSLEFKRGFRGCFTLGAIAGAGDWLLLSSDGNHVKLAKTGGVMTCIAYP